MPDGSKDEGVRPVTVATVSIDDQWVELTIGTLE